MGATKVEFRQRGTIMTAFVLLCFWAPWIKSLGIGRRTPLCDWLALEGSRLGLVSFAVAVPLFIGTGLLFASAGVVLRVWGTAYLGLPTVSNEAMLADGVLTDGPFRMMRNPLYLGSWCMYAAMAFLMPVTGAIVAMPLLTVFLLRLIGSEEAFLTDQLGQPYQEYLHSVPRLFPRLRSVIAPGCAKPSARKPQWMHAVLSQSMAIGTFITLAVFRWSHGNWILAQIILATLGVSLLTKAMLTRIQKRVPRKI